MNKVFVADDEEIIRAGIRNCIEKKTDFYTICGEAPDGEMALPLIQELKPDILIADVCMPFMDGLDLAALVRRTMPWVHIVIVSGHDEFGYAQKAVSLGVDAYLLKPVDSVKLLEALDQIAEKIEEEKRSYLELEEHLKRDEWETAILREYFLSQLVVGALGLTEALELAEKHGISLLDKKYVVCQALLPSDEMAQGLQRIRLVGEHVFGERQDSIWFIHGADQLVFIIKGEGDSAVREAAYEAAQNLRHELKRYLNMDASVSVGSIVDRVGELPKSHQAAKSVFGSGLIFRGSKIIGFDDVQLERISPRQPISFSVSLEEQLRHAEEKDLPQILDHYFKEVTDESVDSVLFRYYLLTNLIVTASRLTKEKRDGDKGDEAGGKAVHGGQLQRSFAESPRGVMAIAGSMEEAKSFALDILQEMIAFRHLSLGIPYGKEIRQAKEYIDDHYDEQDLSLHTVAKQVGFSPSHFSAIFSQETGRTFIEYLTKRRIEAAKRQLTETSAKLHEIATAIGYSDSHYFSYVFKKHVGVSPKEYRSSGQHLD